MAKETVPGQHGGYRKPSAPAAVSGPGKFSARTDGKPGAQPVRDVTGLPYGEGQAFSQLQGSAPMADSQGTPAAPPFAGDAPTPLHAPTERPDEPITSGVDVGPGVGADQMAPPVDVRADLQRAQQYLPLLEPFANHPSTSEAFRLLVQFIKNG